jgi:hypothetical protein
MFRNFAVLSHFHHHRVAAPIAGGPDEPIYEFNPIQLDTVHAFHVSFKGLEFREPFQKLPRLECS